MSNVECTNNRELSFTLTVKLDKKGVEHDLQMNVEGYTKSATADVQDIVNEDVDFLVEDMRRRVSIL